jgi:predicted PurR-regulated permease PerM
VSFTALLYRDGEALAGQIRRIVAPRLGPRGEFHLGQTILAVRATVYGTIVVGLIDGTLIGITYALAGVQSKTELRCPRRAEFGQRGPAMRRAIRPV